jgi:CarD family transcriptional regulator
MSSKSTAKKKPVTKATTKPAAKAKPTLKTVAKKPVAKAKPVAKVKAPVKPVAKAPAKIVVPAKTTAKQPANAPQKVAAKAIKTETPMQHVAKAAANAPAKTAKNDNAAVTPPAAPVFKAGDKVVYPAHGVGRVDGIEKLSVQGVEVTLYTITFEKDRMRLKLPMQKVATSGLRRLASKEQMGEVFQTMKGRARIRRVMWSRRAQEYEAKINSGSPVQVAEVLRDLKRNVTSTEHSYSERQVFQQALERLASEYAAIENIAEDKAAEKLQNILVDAA